MNAAMALSTGYEWIGYDVAGLDQAVLIRHNLALLMPGKNQSVQSSEPVKLDVWNSRVRNLISPNATLDCLAKGFQFLEGPVWDNTRGCLFFSDVPGNTKYRYTLDGRMATGNQVTTQTVIYLINRKACCL